MRNTPDNAPDDWDAPGAVKIDPGVLTDIAYGLTTRGYEAIYNRQSAVLGFRPPPTMNFRRQPRLGHPSEALIRDTVHLAITLDPFTGMAEISLSIPHQMPLIERNIIPNAVLRTVDALYERLLEMVNP